MDCCFLHISTADKNVCEISFISDYTKKTALLQVWALAYFLSGQHALFYPA